VDTNARVIFSSTSTKAGQQANLEEVIAGASGKQSESEVKGIGEEEFAPWILGATMQEGETSLASSGFACCLDQSRKQLISDRCAPTSDQIVSGFGCVALHASKGVVTLRDIVQTLTLETGEGWREPPEMRHQERRDAGETVPGEEVAFDSLAVHRADLILRQLLLRWASSFQTTSLP
jgi:hypothetical protein